MHDHTVSTEELLQLQQAATTLEIVSAIVDAETIPDYSLRDVLRAVLGPATLL